jgi:hypothetical protein
VHFPLDMIRARIISQFFPTILKAPPNELMRRSGLALTQEVNGRLPLADRGKREPMNRGASHASEIFPYNFLACMRYSPRLDRGEWLRRAAWRFKGRGGASLPRFPPFDCRSGP